MMRRFLPLLLLSFMAMGAMAQISVKSFQLLEMDLTASSREGKRIDQNGDVCALIKIETTETNFDFEAGSLGTMGWKQETGEVWLWVPRASRKITIKHPKYGVLRDYRYPIEIEAERTYLMKLEIIKKGSSGGGDTPEVNTTFLAFMITPKPPEAHPILEVNNELWDVDAEGYANKFVEFGSYQWRVSASNYQNDAGVVEVNQVDMQPVQIKLRPDFGYIQVPAEGNLRDAIVYVDSDMLGKAPCMSGRLKSGKHTVRITKKMYEQYSGVVEVKENDTIIVAPKLKADFSEVTLKVDANAEIWVNNEKKGVRVWTGALPSGTYKVECKMPSHEASQTILNITPNLVDPEFTLPLPKPIYGSLSVESTPSFANIYVDGNLLGTTPKFVPEILIGTHEIKLVKDGYIDTEERVTIAKGERTQLSLTLNSYDVKKYNEFLTLAEKKKNAGEFDQAVKYYQDAYNIHHDSEIQKKVELAQNLKTGFEAVNTNIANKNYDQADRLIQNILQKDPNNAMAVQKSKEIKEQMRKDDVAMAKNELDFAERNRKDNKFNEAREHVKKAEKLDPDNPRINEMRKSINDAEEKYNADVRIGKWRRLTSGFRGSYQKHENLGGLHVEFGWSWQKYQLLTTESVKGFRTKVYYANFNHFPFMIDLNANLGKNFNTVGAGLGSAITFGNRFAVNYGGGYRWNWYSMDDVALGRTNNFYYSVGATLMFDPQYGGLSYSYEHSIGDDIFPASRHNLTYVCGRTLSWYFAFLGALYGVYAIIGANK